MATDTTTTRNALLIGGRFDGARVQTPCPEFVWIGGSDKRPRRFRAPGPGRVLYRLKTTGGDLKGNILSQTLIVAQHTHRFCAPDCGFTEIGEGERNPKCEFCGKALPAPV